MDASVIFVSIFLGLTAGLQPVEVAVDGPVASVEILLDDRSVGIIEGEPWRLRCDFGHDLLPHQLVAVARDAEGKELTRARQLVNLPRGDAECHLLLQRDEAGLPRSARVLWQSTEELQPEQTRITLDLQPLTATDLDSIDLPDYDPARNHFLSVELEFANGTACRAESGFGGSLGSEIRTDLTAVPVFVAAGAEEPTVESLQGRFRVSGEEVPVVAVDSGGTAVYVIRDILAGTAFAQMEAQNVAFVASRRGLATEEYTRISNTQMAKVCERTEGDRMVILHSRPARLANDRQTNVIFPKSPSFNLSDRGLPWLITRVLFDEGEDEQQRLADAVAAAAVRAAATQVRRAVLLVVDAEAEDGSQWPPHNVLRYLQQIHVPLVVWRTGDPEKQDNRWQHDQVIPEGLNIRNYNAMTKAVVKLRDMLARQRIVWLDGQYLPNEITLDRTRGIRIAR